MLIARTLRSKQIPKQGCVLTIGNFDGVHLGHQEIIKSARNKANNLGLPLLVMTFDPTPQEYFQSKWAVPRLINYAEKIMLLRVLTVDVLLCLRFGVELASISAQDFITQILCHQLKVRHLLIGDDFHFGASREGNLATLQAATLNAGFAVSHMDAIMIDQLRVSSTHIRKLLQAGNFAQAALLLGRPYMISGRVAYGDQRGRLLGFPTLNLVLRRPRPMTGVFAARVYGLEETSIHGVANLGLRPTVGDAKQQLEVHLFDYDKDAYGYRIWVELIHKIRDEKKFSSFDKLKTQIGLDQLEAQKILK